MGDAAAAGDGCCALCVLCCTESLLSWCNFKAFGGGSSSSTAGCCTSCCKGSFDEDHFENELDTQRKAAETQKANGDPSGNQPLPQTEMTTGRSGDKEQSSADAVRGQ